MSTTWKRVVIAIIGVAMVLLLAAGGVVISQERSRVTDLEDQVDSLRDETEDRRTDEERAELAKSELEADLERTRRRLDRALKGSLDQETCIARLSDENVIGEQDATFGFVIEVADGGFVFDPAEWFVGPEADQAAVEEGEIEPGEHVPNDYFIRNDERTEVAKRFDERAVVVLSTVARGSLTNTGIPAPKCVTPQRFRAAFGDPEPWQGGIRRSPYWLVERNGMVIRLVEQYRP